MNGFIKKSREDIILDVSIVVILVLLSFVTLYPFWNIAAVSLNDALDSIKGGIYFWPREFTLKNYSTIFQNTNLFHATFVSVARTVIGTVTGVLSTIMLAYVLSRKDYVFRGFVLGMFIFTMYFSGGMIPSYMLIRKLHLTNNFLVYIVPGLMSAFNLIVAKSFIEELPESIIEYSKIEGAGDFRIFWSVILPLSLPLIAILSLFVAVGHWNSWFDTFLYNSQEPKLSTLQYELMKILQSSNTATSGANASAIAERVKNGGQAIVTPNAIRATMTIVTTLPIVIIYPFLQKYFVTGFTVGSVKE